MTEPKMKFTKHLLAILAAALIAPAFAAEPAQERQPSGIYAAKKRDNEQYISSAKEKIGEKLSCGGEGLFSGGGFAPLQIDVGIGESNAKLVDGRSDTALALGLFTLHQASSVLSIAPFADFLRNNYGIQTSVFGTVTNRNCGLSLGAIFNLSMENRGVQFGAVYNGDLVSHQLCGLNIADKVLVGVFNREDLDEDGRPCEPSFLQIGAFNRGDSAVQIGVLNYNSRSYIPLLPLVNFAMKKDGEE